LHKGSCLCGSIRYEIDGPLAPIILCHCARCRKASGSAFAAVSPIPAERFRLVSGADALGSYRSSPEAVRSFCRNCGSQIYSRRDTMPEILRLRMGGVDTPVDQKPSEHIFVGSKASWFDIHDEAPQRIERT
jgi:hypothetical protein